MINLIVVMATVLFALVLVQLYAKQKVKKLNKKSSELAEKTEAKLDRLKKLEELTNNKLKTMSYAEQMAQFSSDGICIIDKNKMVYANPAMTKITGYTLSELINSDWSAFSVYEDLEEAIIALETNFQNAIIIDDVYHLIQRWRHKNGNIISLWWSINPLDKDSASYAICRDVSRRQDKKEKIDMIINNLLEKNCENEERILEEITIIEEFIENANLDEEF